MDFEERQPDFTRADRLTTEVEKQIDDAFEYHRWSAEQTAQGNNVRAALAAAVKVIVRDVPPSPDRSAAIRKLREARMDANSAITHSGKY
jgi:ribosomal protein S11